jgi:hypothetical protein
MAEEFDKAKYKKERQAPAPDKPVDKHKKKKKDKPWIVEERSLDRDIFWIRWFFSREEWSVFGRYRTAEEARMVAKKQLLKNNKWWNYEYRIRNQQKE